MENNGQKQIAGAIIIVGFLISGAILLKDSKTPSVAKNEGIPMTTLAPIGKEDRTLGNPKAKVALVMYEDFQCPFCGAVTGLELNSPAMKPVMDYLKKADPKWTPFIPEIINNYVKNGNVLFVYRDFPFLGTESIRASEAARCAEDQGKFWEYHDYLYAHQKGENEGSFSDINLKSFAKKLALDTVNFDKCLDDNKYSQAVTDSKTEATKAGVTGTPKGFILKDGKIFATIDGAESLSTVKEKIESALK